MPDRLDDASVVASARGSHCSVRDLAAALGYPSDKRGRDGGDVQPQPLDRRVERLEQRVTSLEQLPSRIDDLTLQIVQLREEMQKAISASEASLTTRLTTSLTASFRAEIRAAEERLRDEIRAGDREVMSHARVLYEDLRDKLALIIEALPPPRDRGR